MTILLHIRRQMDLDLWFFTWCLSNIRWGHMANSWKGTPNVYPICWEQIESSSEVSWQLNYNDWKQLGFLPQEICNVIISVFSNPSSGPLFAWPGTDWDWILQSHWLAPKGTYWICGAKGVASHWLERRCTLGLAFTHGFTFSEPPEKPANLPHLRTHWIRSVFHWYGYLAAIFVPSLGTTDIMLRVDALTTQ